MNKFILDTIHSISMIEQENVDEPEEENIFDIQQFVDTNTHQNLSNIIEEFTTPDLNETESNTSNEVLPILMKESVLQAISKVTTETTNSDKVTNEMVSTIPKEENAKSTSSSSPPCIALSPDLPPVDDDPIFFSTENSQVPITDTSDIIPQDYIIIVPCSDDEDDDEMNNTDTKIVGSSNNNSPRLFNPPSLTRGNQLYFYFNYFLYLIHF
jgi:hypothetical protein